MITFPCPHCRQENEVEPQHAGQTVACFSCDGDVIVPKARAKARPAVARQEVIARPGFSLHFKSLVKALFLAGVIMMAYQRWQIAQEQREAMAAKKARAQSMASGRMP